MENNEVLGERHGSPVKKIKVTFAKSEPYLLVKIKAFNRLQHKPF